MPTPIRQYAVALLLASGLFGLSAAAPGSETKDGAAPIAPENATSELRAEVKGDTVVVKIRGQLFTVYKFSHGQKYPYFWPVNGPVSRISVTTETAQPWPHHHSLFFGCDKVNGGNYWQDANARGQILSEGPKLIEAAGARVVFTDTCLWRQKGEEPTIRDERRVTISEPSKTLRLIDFEITLVPLTDVRILQSNHSLFAARMMPELSMKAGGTIVNAEGKLFPEGTHGVASAWCDYYGNRNGVTEGLAIFQHPGNPWFPCRWFTRDYGFFSPTPMNWLEGGHFDLPKEQPFTLKYRVLVHGGSTEEAGIAQQFEAYKEAAS